MDARVGGNLGTMGRGGGFPIPPLPPHLLPSPALPHSPFPRKRTHQPRALKEAQAHGVDSTGQLLHHIRQDHFPQAPGVDSMGEPLATDVWGGVRVIQVLRHGCPCRRQPWDHGEGRRLSHPTIAAPPSSFLSPAPLAIPG